MHSEQYAIVHAVTTHGLANKGRIMELAIILSDGRNESGRWSGLVRPRCPVDPQVQRITGISPDMVSSGPSFGLVAARLQRMLRDRTLVMHGAPFGAKVLNHAFARMGLAFSPTTLCTEQLAQLLQPESPRVDMLSMGQPKGKTAAYRALPMAEATRTLLFRFLDQYGEDAVHAHLTPPRRADRRAQAA